MSQVIPLGPAARMLTTREAALRLGVSLRTVQLWVEASILPAARTPGGHRRIPSSAVEALALSTGLGEDMTDSAPAQVVRRTAAPAGKPASSRSTAVQPLDVLLVADEPEWLEQCADALAVFGSGLRLRMVETGYLALLQIGQQAPDLLVTTLELPGMDGFEMLHTLERCETIAGMPVIALTSLCDLEIDDQGGLPESVEVVPLPVTPEALAVRIGRWLIGRRTMSGAHHE